MSDIDINIFNFDIINIINKNLDYIDIIHFSSSTKHLFDIYKNNKKYICSEEIINYQKFINYKLYNHFPKMRLAFKFLEKSDEIYNNNIVKLYIYINDIKYIVGCNNLEELRIINNFDNRIEHNLYYLNNLSKLKILNLFSLELNNINFVSNMPNLKVLDISYNNITDLSPLKNLTKLENLSMIKTKINNLDIFNNLKNLKYLNMYYCEFNNNLNFNIFGNLINLNFLNIGLTKNFNYDVLRLLTNLTTLYVVQTNINNLEPISKLNKLKSLYLSNISDNTDYEPLIDLSYNNDIKIFITKKNKYFNIDKLDANKIIL